MKPFERSDINHERELMRFSKYSHVSNIGTRHFNEDSVFSTPNGIVLVDGASGLGKHHIMEDYPNDVVWFSQSLAHELGKYLATDIPVEIAFHEVINKLQKIYKTELEAKTGETELRDVVDHPAACVVFIRLSKEGLEVANIGDCTTLVIKSDDTVDTIWDLTVPNLDDEVIKKLQILALKDKITLFEARHKYGHLITANRLLANTQDGYWVAALDETFISHLDIRKYELDEVQAIATMTDGFWAAKEVLSPSMNPNQFFNYLRTNLTSVPTLLRSALETDPRGERFPRTKLCDDMTAAIAQI